MVHKLKPRSVHPVPKNLTTHCGRGKEVRIITTPLQGPLNHVIDGGLILAGPAVPHHNRTLTAVIHRTQEWQLIIPRNKVMWHCYGCHNAQC